MYEMYYLYLPDFFLPEQRRVLDYLQYFACNRGVKIPWLDSYLIGKEGRILMNFDLSFQF